jgi:hypothetical protein
VIQRYWGHPSYAPAKPPTLEFLARRRRHTSAIAPTGTVPPNCACLLMHQAWRGPSPSADHHQEGECAVSHDDMKLFGRVELNGDFEDVGSQWDFEIRMASPCGWACLQGPRIDICSGMSAGRRQPFGARLIDYLK